MKLAVFGSVLFAVQSRIGECTLKLQTWKQDIRMLNVLSCDSTVGFSKFEIDKLTKIFSQK